MSSEKRYFYKIIIINNKINNIYNNIEKNEKMNYLGISDSKDMHIKIYGLLLGKI
jgi:abortive infection bacteriophage resistance protein